MSEQPTERAGRRWSRGLHPVGGLLLLCFLWSLGSLRSDLVPDLFQDGLPPLASQAAPLALLAVVTAWAALKRRAEWPRGRLLRIAVLIGFGFFVAPAVLVSLAADQVDALTRVALYALIPVFAVVLEPHYGRTFVRESRFALPAALVAVGGILCIFPLLVPGSWPMALADSAVLGAAAAVAFTNCAAVRVVAEMPERYAAGWIAIVAAAAAAGLALASAVYESAGWSAVNWKPGALLPSLGWLACVDLPALALLFWLMRRMSAVRMTTRFLLAPLMTILFGMALERPSVQPRTWLGLMLLAAGTGVLLFAREGRQDAEALPLHLNRE